MKIVLNIIHFYKNVIHHKYFLKKIVVQWLYIQVSKGKCKDTERREEIDVSKI